MRRSCGRQNIPKILIGFGRHLVYAEGTKTEIFYVKNIRDIVAEKLNVEPRDVSIIPVPANQSKHTNELVSYAINDVKNRRLNGETIDHVWIFYDKDDFEDFDDTFTRIRKLNTLETGKTNEVPCDENGISWHACWSNECFEVWIYHYFENLTVPLERGTYGKHINSFLKQRGCQETYKKNKEKLHTFLTDNGGSIEKAVKWMKRKDVKNDKKPNPSSGVYLFAEFIIKYLNSISK